MAAPLESTPARRAPLSRARVLDVAMAYADTHGIDALSMRSLAQELSVVPMALYMALMLAESFGLAGSKGSDSQ